MLTEAYRAPRQGWFESVEARGHQPRGDEYALIEGDM